MDREGGYGESRIACQKTIFLTDSQDIIVRETQILVEEEFKDVLTPQVYEGGGARVSQEYSRVGVSEKGYSLDQIRSMDGGEEVKFAKSEM